MKAKTNRNVKTAEQAAPPDWWLPQLDTPIGRVELVIFARDRVQVRRAGWMRSFEDLTPHLDEIWLRLTANGHWQPSKTYSARRDREIAQAVSGAVTAWTQTAENKDLLRRALALHECCSPMWRGPVLALQELAGRLSRELGSDRLDLDDAGHARAVVTHAAKRLQDMMLKVSAIADEVRRAIVPTDDRAAAA
jgi:hypothetical protein